MRFVLIISSWFLLAIANRLCAQPIEADLVVPTPLGVNDTLWYRIPEGYNPDHPPAILLWWHAWGGTQREMVDYTQFDDIANARGWIAAGFMGTHRRHWNTDTSQYLCTFTLDYIRERYPFATDSIYMVGSSMGSAAGQVFHNNNCGKDDYIIAATAGGSQILDCELRQLQYLQNQIINESMIAQFGGLPYDSDSVLFNYHRASAISIIGSPYDTLNIDTTHSMHFNSLLIPVYNTWGMNDVERNAYGVIGAIWAGMRTGWAPTYNVESDISDHGLWCMYAEQIVPWLAQFSARRDPDTLTISADSDTNWYYWTKPVRDSAYVFGRYGVNRDRERDSLDVYLIRHVQELTIDATSLVTSEPSTLYVTARNYDSGIISPRIILSELGADLRTSISVQSESGPVQWEFVPGNESALQFTLTADTSYVITLGELASQTGRPKLPVSVRISAAYPNPFNSEISIEINSDITSSSTINVFNVQGQLAKSIPITLSPGTAKVTLDANDLSTGIYFLNMSGYHSPPIKVVLLK